MAVIKVQSLLSETHRTNSHFINHLYRTILSTFVKFFRKQVSSDNIQHDPSQESNRDPYRERLQDLTGGL